jgi:acetylornithine deacetylase/succinyl-diaminopimelate desuccinylase-like protein
MRTAASICLLLLLAACRGADAVEEDPLDAQAERMLVDYLKIDTTNPPGNETRGSEFLLAEFKREGIEAQLVGSNPNRRGVYARLSSGSKEKALLLMNHIDVVPAIASDWTMPPFSGAKAGGYIWGRGALDTKSLAVAQMISMIALKRRQTPLRRDIIFLAVPDEEGGGLRGAKTILEENPALFENVGFLLNEGGGNKTVVDRVTWWGIEIDQKVPLWLEVSTQSSGGHASMVSGEQTAITKLLAVLRDLESLPMAAADAASARRFADAAGGATVDGGPEAAWVGRDTLVVTALRAGTSVNSLPARATALLDCRLVHGRSPAPLLAKIRETVGDRGTVNVLLGSDPPPPSSTDTALYRTLSAVLSKAERGSKVSPIITTGTTDSRFFRARGITAYGFSPFKVNYYDYGTIHGVDEKVRVSFFREGTHVMRSVLESFCAR